jgi:hypothetical protein
MPRALTAREVVARGERTAPGASPERSCRSRLAAVAFRSAELPQRAARPSAHAEVRPPQTRPRWLRFEKTRHHLGRHSKGSGPFPSIRFRTPLFHSRRQDPFWQFGSRPLYPFERVRALSGVSVSGLFISVPVSGAMASFQKNISGSRTSGLALPTSGGVARREKLARRRGSLGPRQGAHRAGNLRCSVGWLLLRSRFRCTSFSRGSGGHGGGLDSRHFRRRHQNDVTDAARASA